MNLKLRIARNSHIIAIIKTVLNYGIELGQKKDGSIKKNNVKAVSSEININNCKHEMLCKTGIKS